jgi:type 1 glutamine amidotransferase
MAMHRRAVLAAALALAFAAAVAAVAPAAAEDAPAKIRVLLLTGGHDFEVKPFYEMWDAFPGVAYTKATMPKDAGLLKPGLEKEVDVVVTYDMSPDIPEEQRKAFVELLNAGIGYLPMHHALGGHKNWDEYLKIVGGRYVFKPFEADGKTHGKSTYAHDQDLKVTVADKDHPITKGVKDFQIHDETYGNCYVAPGVKVLLTTDHPKGTPQVAWTTKYGKSPVFYYMLGHDSKAWASPEYKQILLNGIKWLAAERPK